jgi:hypothetical protein
MHEDEEGAFSAEIAQQEFEEAVDHKGLVSKATRRKKAAGGRSLSQHGSTFAKRKVEGLTS